MDPRLVYLAGHDVVAILGGATLVAALLLPIVLKGGTELAPSDWTRIRASAYGPFGLTLGVCFFASSMFTPIRLIYHVGATVLPLTGVLMLAIIARREIASRAHKVSLTVFAIVLVLLAPLAFWMTVIEPLWLEVTETTVTTDARDVEEIRVVVLADVQTDFFGTYHERVVREANALEPDLIVIPGDFLQIPIDRYQEELPNARAMLAKLKAKHGVFMVDGDVDYDVRDYQEGTGVQILYNDIAHVDIADRRVAIAGVETNFETADAASTIARLEVDESELKLLVAHRPMVAEREMRDASTIDLVIVGHTHGGQVSIPFFGPPITMTAAPRDIADGGLGRLGGRQIYVSRGIGLERKTAPRMRLNCRPELPLIRIR